MTAPRNDHQILKSNLAPTGPSTHDSTNGCAERFIRTLKENLLWVRHFDSIEELRQALQAFKETYNRTWIVERHGYRTPAAVRAAQHAPLPVAA